MANNPDAVYNRISSGKIEMLRPTIDVNDFSYIIPTPEGVQTGISLAGLSSLLIKNGFIPIGVGGYTDLEQVLRGDMVATDRELLRVSLCAQLGASV